MVKTEAKTGRPCFRAPIRGRGRLCAKRGFRKAARLE